MRSEENGGVCATCTSSPTFRDAQCSRGSSPVGRTCPRSPLREVDAETSLSLDVHAAVPPAGLLKRILGDYVQDIDREALRLSVWKARPPPRPFFHLSICSALIAQLITRSLCPQGDVELHNIRLRPEAFITADLPVEVVAGTAAFVKLKVPWRHLGRQPVMVEMDRVYLLAREERLDGPSGQHTEDSDAALRSKQSQLDTQETEWLASRCVTSPLSAFHVFRHVCTYPSTLALDAGLERSRNRHLAVVVACLVISSTPFLATFSCTFPTSTSEWRERHSLRA